MPTEPLRIVHCLRAPVGGLFRHVCDLAEAQAERGHLVGLIADASTGGATATARFERLNQVCKLGITRFPMARLPGPGDVAVARRIGRLAGALKPDVLHGHGAKGGAYARIAGTRLRENGPRPIRAYTPHGGSLHYGKLSPAGFVFLAVERHLASRTDVFLFESEYGLRTFTDKVGPPPGIVRVVHNGLAPDEFTPVVAADDAADFVFIGELRALKGIDTLLEALARLARDGAGPTAVIVGAGADGDKLRMTAETLGLAARVRFPGAMPAREAFQLGRCVVVPSRAESLPYVVLEAAAAGLPIVSTDVGGIPEIFGVQADRLVPPDDPERLAAAMGRVLDDPNRAKDDARALSEDVAGRFSIAGMTDAILDAYVTET
ncbi:glycosyltransferase family 4 protein [Microbaculum sp. FT89]|uniref:glycosyltransferase family 4 protein n=1 Tax=Microbaculum sp. FT89 TaxID=3447298 RepID=UPI003F53A8F3